MADRAGLREAIACCRSVVNVAIPQRRGSELPMKASREIGAMEHLALTEWTNASSHGRKGATAKQHV
jgi:hypothetical protein